MIMLAIRVRDSPCSERAVRSSLGRDTTTWPPSTFAVIGSATTWLRVPLGPLTVTFWPSIATSTPAGIAMGFLPIRDIVQPPPHQT